MTETSYEGILERLERIPKEAQELILALKYSHLNRYVLDDDGEVFGYREPAMFEGEKPIKWLAEILSLETGKPVPLLDAAGVVADPAAPEVARVATGPAMGETRWLRHADFMLSPLDPRTNLNPAKMAELKESLRTRGWVEGMSRLWARPHPSGKFELIAGGRRWRNAGELIAERVLEDRLPAVIEEKTDAEVLELALVDNSDRDNLSPLDEALGVCRMLDLRDEAGALLYTAKTLGDRLGRDAMHISRCRALSRLRGTATGDYIESGALSAKHGELLARIASPAQRASITERAVNPSDGKPVSTRTLENWISLEVQVLLRGARFDQRDAELVPVVTDAHGQRVAGGACIDCIHNSKNFEAADRSPKATAICMNPDCYALKTAAMHRLWAESVKAPGVDPLPPEDVAIVFEDDGVTLRANGGRVELDANPEPWELKEGCEKAAAAWSKLTRGRDLQEQWIQDAKGRVRKLANRDMAIAAAVENRHDIFRRGKQLEDPKPVEDAIDRAAGHVQRTQEDAAARAKREEENEEKRVAWMAEVGAVIAALEACEAVPDKLSAVLWWVLNGYFPEGISVAAERRGMEPEEFDAHAAKLSGVRGAGAVVEMIIQQTWWDNGDVEGGLVLSEFAKLLKVDLKAASKAALSNLKKQRKEEAKRGAPMTVREDILFLAGGHQMSADCLNVVAARVLGKPYEERPWEEARGGELTAILEEVRALAMLDETKGWMVDADMDTFVCPRCGGASEFKLSQMKGDGSASTPCSSACGYNGLVIRHDLDRALNPALPVPNENGVFSEKEAEIIGFKVKKAYANLRVLQIREGVWIAAPDVSIGGAGWSSPLQDRDTFEQRGEAVEEGLLDIKARLLLLQPDSAAQKMTINALVAQVSEKLKEQLSENEAPGWLLWEQLKAKERKAAKKDLGEAWDEAAQFALVEGKWVQSQVGEGATK